MLHNTELTIYHKQYDSDTRMDVWIRTYVEKAWWFKQEKSSLTVEGLKQADVYTIRIDTTDIVVVKEDYLVKGGCDREISSPTELFDLECCKVTSVSYNTFGGNPHIKIGGV